MVWIYSPTEPVAVETKNHLGQQQRTVNFNLEKLKEDDPTGYKWRFNSVTLEPGVWSYEPLVSALVRELYPDDAMTAIINNYLADPNSEEAKAEMQEMQEWRTRAKEIAKKCLDNE